MSKQAMTGPLSDDEYADLDTLLAAPELGERAMDVSTLEGFLTAVAIGPNPVLPSQWLPWVWDMEAGAAGMSGLGAGDAERIAGLVMRHYNHMVTWMTQDPDSFDPIYTCGAEWGAAEWCEGFLLGMQLDGDGWRPLQVSEPAWFAPFMRLGTSDGAALTAQHDDAGHWMDEVVPSVVKINAFWMRQRGVPMPASAHEGGKRPVVRETPKVGRNDPCHCGSGKKYKKCCGAAEA
ncbi:YecA family protein [Janthinobacterium fluminis]|uniref:UPF0149 family protein n=1 Tax=Janthinobacterium fluminis TaxID=2987524 RepID=A0ABT5JZR4_9BURK|nr:UPF0149 family protein [Janthinobacterium fluminis]MDC8758223.1 UPF0149 family protein [Janthinobacterium fluminis]